MALLDRILRAGDGKRVKALQGIIPDVNGLSASMAALSDD
ncbi:MAG: preprotein translocase SecA subunit, partial [Actinomycetota bacterium]